MSRHYWSECKFDTTIQQLIQSYLKEYSDKSMTYQKLQADSEYKTVLEEARQGAKQTAKDEQKQRVKMF